MEKRIVFLLDKYVKRKISPEEVNEIKDFMQSSKQNRDLVNAFIQLNKTELQASMAARADKDKAWKRIKRHMDTHKRKLIISWAASVAVILAVASTATIVYTHLSHQSEIAMNAVMQAEAQNHAVITLTENEGIEIDGAKPSQFKDKNGKVICENKDGKVVYFSHIAQPMYHKVSVKEGSTYKITLSDGTNITLASGAEMIYPIGGEKRDVRLKGEAFFEVTHNENSPFTVACTNGSQVTVLGTRFNVSARENMPVTVTVESGKVGVTYRDATSYLHTNEQVSTEESTLGSVNKVDAKLYTSWANGIYEFDDVPMQVITQQLSLWYGVDFVFASPQLKERKFTGALLRDEKLGYTLSLLKDVSNLNFSISENKVTIE